MLLLRGVKPRSSGEHITTWMDLPNHQGHLSGDGGGGPSSVRDRTPEPVDHSRQLVEAARSRWSRALSATPM